MANEWHRLMATRYRAPTKACFSEPVKATLKSNTTIMTSTTAGVELGCFSATLTGNNLINDAPVGVDAAPGVGPRIGHFRQYRHHLHQWLRLCCDCPADGSRLRDRPGHGAPFQFVGAVAHAGDAFRHAHEVTRGGVCT